MMLLKEIERSPFRRAFFNTMLPFLLTTQTNVEKCMESL